MNKTIPIIQTVCLVFIVILLAILVKENRYSYGMRPDVYDPFEKGSMHPGANLIYDNIFNMFRGYDDKEWHPFK